MYLITITTPGNTETPFRTASTISEAEELLTEHYNNSGLPIVAASLYCDDAKGFFEYHSAIEPLITD